MFVRTNSVKAFAAVFCICLQTCLGGYWPTTPTVGRPWPLPQSELEVAGNFSVDSTAFSFQSIGYDCDILQQAYTRYLNIAFPSVPSKLSGKSSPANDGPPLLTLEVDVLTECETLPRLNMDESYELKICATDDPTRAVLTAPSVWGALRGLETFSQLLVKMSEPTMYAISCTEISDFPRFSHRGLMLDTSRHFLPVDTIKDNLDLMAMNKFNVFHWHIVDDQSFPYESGVYPDLSGEGAYSDIHHYTAAEVADIIEYSRLLGIRVIVEFDTPGHTRSWGYGQPGLLTECYSLGVPDGSYGPIDPSKEENFVFLDNLFTEIGGRFPDHYLHLGGDEVNTDCWASNPDINAFMDSLNMTDDYQELMNYYFARLLDIVHTIPAVDGYVVWQEVFDNEVEIKNDTVVHVWKGADNPSIYHPEMDRVTAAGYQALLSSCWYLNYIDYGEDWREYYQCEPLGFNGTASQYQLVIGGEACMWAEYVDKTNIIPRTWPRASAVAERLWSPVALTQSDEEAAPRLEEHRCRLQRRGYPAQPLAPSYCEGIL